MKKLFIVGLILLSSHLFAGPSFTASSDGFVVVQEKILQINYNNSGLMIYENVLALVRFKEKIKELESQGLVKYGPEITPELGHPFFEQVMIQPKYFHPEDLKRVIPN